MSNKHSHGPRCPICRRTFRLVRDLEAHQQSKGHQAEIQVRDDEEHARARMQAYHQDKARQ